MDGFLVCGACEYKCKNRNRMRVHLRTKHQIYLCSHATGTGGFCLQRFTLHRDWKAHLVSAHNVKN